MVTLGRDRKSTYWAFAVENHRLLAFGFLAAFCSSFGQTFFISLFSGEIRAEFALSDGDFGALYSAATLVSGFSLIWLGRKIDQLDLRVYSALVGVALIYLMAMGVTSGMTATIVTAVWAELYGVLHLGAIRALAAALAVLSSALSPVSIGWMIDRGISMEAVALLCLAYIGLATALVLPVVRWQSAGRTAAG